MLLAVPIVMGLSGGEGPPAVGTPAAAVAPAPAVPLTPQPAATVPEQPTAAPPVRIRLPTLGVDAAVVAEGVDADGEMQVPNDIDQTGWYRFGPAPGSPTGSTVVSGHVDDRVQGRGAFYRLADLRTGDPVNVTTAAGGELAYRVVDIRRIAKPDLPADELFALDGPPRLTLITCGGSFDWASRNYRDNVVVTADPLIPGARTGPPR